MRRSTAHLQIINGVNMAFSQIRRQVVTGMMAVALVAGFSVKTFAADDLLAQVKSKGELRVGLEGTYPPFSFQDEKGKLTGFEVEFAQDLAKHMGVKAVLSRPSGMAC